VDTEEFALEEEVADEVPAGEELLGVIAAEDEEAVAGLLELGLLAIAELL